MLKTSIKYTSGIILGILILALGQFPCFAQNSGDTTNQQATGADQQIPPAIAKELDAMRKRIDELEAELRSACGRKRSCACVCTKRPLFRDLSKVHDHPVTVVSLAKA